MFNKKNLRKIVVRKEYKNLKISFLFALLVSRTFILEPYLKFKSTVRIVIFFI